MAKTARKRKSKQEQVSEELKLRIICLFFIFLVIIAAMQLGVIGDHLNYVFMYVFGNLNGIIYLTCILLLGYIVIKADFPKFNGPKAAGLYLLFIGLTLFISATPSLTGIKVIQSYFNQVPLNRGGFAAGSARSGRTGGRSWAARPAPTGRCARSTCRGGCPRAFWTRSVPGSGGRTPK